MGEKNSSIKAGEKIFEKERSRLIKIALVVLLVSFWGCFFIDGSWLERIGLYLCFYLPVIAIILTITGKDDNKIIEEYLIKDYNCVKTSFGCEIELNKGYRGEFIYYMSTSNDYFGRLHDYCNMRIKFEVKKYPLFDEPNEKIKIKNDSKNLVEKILTTNKELNLTFDIYHDVLKIQGSKTISFMLNPFNRFEIFFYMVDKCIQIANIIIDDENS